jgi:invasion protein IalB
MKLTPLVMSLVFGLAASTAATAQETATPQAPAPAAAATPPGGDLALGAGDEPRVGNIYQREVHGDWAVRCVKMAEGQADPCQLFQRMVDQEGNPTADINFFDVADGGQVAGGATVVTPLQTLLTAQVTLIVDGGAERRYPFAFCDAQGCYSRMGFTAEEMAQFRGGKQATVKVRPAAAPDQEVIMSVSLTGFTAGIQSITVANPQ